MTEKPGKRYAAQCTDAHPELFDMRARPPKAATNKPGQLSEAMVKQYFEKVSVHWDLFLLVVKTRLDVLKTHVYAPWLVKSHTDLSRVVKISPVHERVN